MSRKRSQERSVGQRVANRGRERRLTRDDAFTAYAMDRLLCRLGKSAQVSEFLLKGGVLVAHLVDAPHRFTRDIDFLRRHGPADPDDIRQRFREVVSVRLDDGVDFDPAGVRAVTADHDEDGYDGVKVFVCTRVAGHTFDLRVDIGFGDALEPHATRIQLDPFLDDDEPARLLAYEPGPVLAEKIETLLSKFPVIQHRLKDLLDVVVLSATLDFEGDQLTESLRATLDRRGTRPDPRVLDDLRTELTGRRWQTDWATMLREKAVARPMELADAITRFDAFVRPLLDAVGGAAPPGTWTASGPSWSPRRVRVPSLRRDVHARASFGRSSTATISGPRGAAPPGLRSRPRPVADMRSARDPEAFCAAERALVALAQKVASDVTQRVVQDVSDDKARRREAFAGVRARAAERGIGMRNERDRRTEFRTLGGSTVEVTTPYATARPRAGVTRKKRGAQGTGVYPVLDQLGISDRSTPAMRLRVARAVCEANSVTSARDLLASGGVDVDHKAALRLTYAVCDAALRARTEAMRATAGGAEVGPFVGRRVVAAVNGGRVNIRKRVAGRPRKGGRKRFETEWREPKVLTIYVLGPDGRRDRTVPSVIDGTLGDADAVFELLGYHLLRLGACHAAELVLIGDGATWTSAGSSGGGPSEVSVAGGRSAWQIGRGLVRCGGWIGDL